MDFFVFSQVLHTFILLEKYYSGKKLYKKPAHTDVAGKQGISLNNPYQQRGFFSEARNSLRIVFRLRSNWRAAALSPFAPRTSSRQSALVILATNSLSCKRATRISCDRPSTPPASRRSIVRINRCNNRPNFTNNLLQLLFCLMFN